MRTKGIGPQGLGLKGNNGYHIGSPAKQTTKGLNTEERRNEYMGSIYDKQREDQSKVSAENYINASISMKNIAPGERSKIAQGYADHLAKKREKNVYKPARDKAAKKFDKATRYDDMLGRASSPAKQTTAAEFAYEKSLKDKEMGKSTKVVDKVKAAATALTSDKTYAGEKAKYRAERKKAYNKKMQK